MFWLIALLGCNDGGADPVRPGAPPPMPDIVPTAGQQTCASNSDCVAVEIGCCNHCNGGRVVAVNRDSQSVLESERQGPCDDMVCTRLSCRPSKVRCDAGTCSVVGR